MTWENMKNLQDMETKFTVRDSDTYLEEKWGMECLSETR